MPVPLPATTRSLWQVTQYRSSSARCADTDAAPGSSACANAVPTAAAGSMRTAATPAANQLLRTDGPFRIVWRGNEIR